MQNARPPVDRDLNRYTGPRKIIGNVARQGHLTLGLVDSGKASEDSDMTSAMLDSTADAVNTDSRFRTSGNPAFVPVEKLMRKVKP